MSEVPENVERAVQTRLSGGEDFKVSGWGYRHQQSLILFFALAIAYSMRSCMGVALVAMTHQNIKPDNVTELLNGAATNNNSTSQMEGNFEVHGFFNALMLTPPYPQFKWSKKVQDTIISSFVWGYMSLQLPAGYLVHRLGSIRLISGAMFINCVMALIIPPGAYYGGWVCVLFFRVIQGMSQACIMPGLHHFFGKWATLEERGRLTSLTYGGQALGTVLGLPITGFLASSPMGWPGIFRFYALLSGTISAVVWKMARDTPAAHPKISKAERKYIENGLGQKPGYENVKLSVPWSKILRHIGVYAIIVSHIGNTWGQLVLYSEVPYFMDKVMGVDIKANGLLTALPFVVMWFTNFFFSWFTDMLIVRKVMSVTNVRKLANSIGAIPPSLGLIALAYVPKNIYAVESILVIICSFKISAHMGFQVNHIDISPNFAGTLMSLSNFVSNAVGSLAPIIAGFILTDVTSEYLWSIVFLLTSGLYFFTNLFYIVYGTSEKADWNDLPESNNVEEKPEEDVPMLIKKEENGKF